MCEEERTSFVDNSQHAISTAEGLSHTRHQQLRRIFFVCRDSLIITTKILENGQD